MSRCRGGLDGKQDPEGEMTGIYGALVKRTSRKMFGEGGRACGRDLAQSVGPAADASGRPLMESSAFIALVNFMTRSNTALASSRSASSSPATCGRSWSPPPGRPAAAVGDIGVLDSKMTRKRSGSTAATTSESTPRSSVPIHSNAALHCSSPIRWLKTSTPRVERALDRSGDDGSTGTTARICLARRTLGWEANVVPAGRSALGQGDAERLCRLDLPLVAGEEADLVGGGLGEFRRTQPDGSHPVCAAMHCGRTAARARWCRCPERQRRGARYRSCRPCTDPTTRRR